MVKRVPVAADMNIKPIAVVASRRTRAFASRRHRAPDHAGRCAVMPETNQLAGEMVRPDTSHHLQLMVSETAPQAIAK